MSRLKISYNVKGKKEHEIYIVFQVFIRNVATNTLSKGKRCYINTMFQVFLSSLAIGVSNFYE